jgi:hypothetical protein
MHIIVYTSELAHINNDINNSLCDIVKKAKANNLKLGITGVIFYHNKRFVQIIEGEKDSLEYLMSIIEKDTRHKNIVRIIDEEINKRGFMQWNMDSFNLDENDKIDPEELENIRDAYKRNLKLDSELLVVIYKKLLASHTLNPKKKC